MNQLPDAIWRAASSEKVKAELNKAHPELNSRIIL